jgi:hypothetical protein
MNKLTSEQAKVMVVQVAAVLRGKSAPIINSGVFWVSGTLLFLNCEGKKVATRFAIPTRYSIPRVNITSLAFFSPW